MEERALFSLPQSRLNLDDGGDSICAVSVRNGGVLFRAVVAEQKHFLAVEVIFGPSDVRQYARGCGAFRMVRVLMVNEVDWCDPCQSQRPHKQRGGEGGTDTYLWHPCQGDHP
jgi:hypothetical protein